MLPCFSCFVEGFASAEATRGLSGRPPGPLRGPPLEANGEAYKNWIFVGGKGKMLPCFFCFVEDFASAEATRGLSGRPLDPFGDHLLRRMGRLKKLDSLWEARERCFLAFPVSWRVSPLRRRPGGFPVAPLDPFGNPALDSQSPLEYPSPQSTPFSREQSKVPAADRP